MAKALKPVWHRFGRFLVPSIVIAAMLAVFIGPARAVHEAGVFELDTGTGGANATTNHAGTGAPDDWDRVCHQVVTSDCSTTNNTAGATAVSWTPDGNLNATIFTGGGSKDPQDISSWLWKDGAGGLPDKDNLQHAFASRYSIPPTAAGYGGTDPTPGTNPADDGTCPAPNAGDPCDVLYFGMDRYDNSGDAQLGFWFFQNAVTTGGTSSQGGTTFTGVHKPGDLLILSDFSVGGTTSTIDLYKWVDSGGDVSTHLLSLGGGDNRDCSLISSNDSFCGIVNKDPTPSSNPNDDVTTSPWTFGDKSGKTGFLPGELYEGGVNLSALGLGGECFTSFLSESRSSTSPTATLKDFVLGGFGSCTTSIATSQTWTPHDSGTITVTGTNSWSGTVQFTLFNNGTCTPGASNANVLYQSNKIGVSNSDPTASTDDATTQPSAVSSSGTYSWQVDFVSGTTGVPDQTSCVERTDLTITNS